MGKNRLMQVSYYDPKAEVRLTTYADTLIIDQKHVLAAIRFGGYPEQVKAMSDAIYGGCGFDVENNGVPKRIHSLTKQYRRQVTHDGLYAEATLLVNDDQDDATVDEEQEELSRPKKTYIFCDQNNPKALFDELDKKTSVPLIPEYQDYFLSELQKRNLLKPLDVISLRERFEAWVLESTQDDKPLIGVIEDGLKSGAISIPGAVSTNAFDGVSTVSQYLKAFGVTVAERIKNLFKPLFDPATEQLSSNVLSVNEYMRSKTRYSLYDAQLAVAESLKRQLDQRNVALTVAECGSGKTKIGSTALYAHQQGKNPGGKTFNIVLCPSQITDKWVREIEETLPNTFAGVVTDPTELDKLYAAYERDNKTAFAVISKEMARDGYMKRPAVLWNRRRRAFLCPDCGTVLMMDLMEDGSKYRVRADQFFFKQETTESHKCDDCGSLLWTALNPDRQSQWVKIGGYGFVYRSMAYEHLKNCKNPGVLEQLEKIVDDPQGYYHAAGAYRRVALSTYTKNKLKGRLDGLILDELHQYSGQSGQGDAMAELVGVAKKVVGMTATLINGYSKGVFYLLFRLASELMLKDGREFCKPQDFNKEYGVVESIYEMKEADYNANRRASKTKKQERQLPGVSPLVYTRFLMETAAFLSLQDMGKDLPEYEEIPVPLDMLRRKQVVSQSRVFNAISLDELEKMQEEAGYLDIPDAVSELMDDILCELRKLGIHVSDRKYFNYAPLARAKAWLSGASEVSPLHLMVLKNYLWTTPEEIAVIEQVLTRMCQNPLQDKLDNLRAMAVDSLDELKANSANKKSMLKFRSEFVRLYDMVRDLETKAASDAEKSQIGDFLTALESMSREAHDIVGFTYASLDELKALQ